jgi:MoxR-vWA-beta-propeller ternary system domain bpX2
MSEPLDEVCCASLPAESLPALAELRAHQGIRVKRVGGIAWVFWKAGDSAVLRRVLPVRGAEVFARRGDFWVRPGHSLPAFGVPDDTGTKPLGEVVFPEAVRPLVVERLSLERIRLSLTRDDRPRPATALLCRLGELGRWADGVPECRLSSLEAAHCDELALVRGERLPELSGGERFWGGAVLSPLGFRPEPTLAEREWGRAIGLADGDLALLTAEGAEVIDSGLFQRLTRAGLHLALRGRS